MNHYVEYKCRHCEDQFWIYINGVRTACECYKCDEKTHNPRNIYCGVNSKVFNKENRNQTIKSYNLDTYKPRNNKQVNARELAYKFIRNEVRNLCISGDYQTGKTILINAIGNSIGNNIGNELINTYDLSNRMRFDIKIGESISDVDERLNYLKKIPILLFELLHYESMYTPRLKDVLSDIICFRTDQDDLKTVLTISPNIYQMKRYSLQADKRLEKYFTIVETDT